MQICRGDEKTEDSGTELNRRSRSSVRLRKDHKDIKKIRMNKKVNKMKTIRRS